MAKASKRGHVYLPYATIDDKGLLVRHPPERYLELPFNETLAAVAFVEGIYMYVKTFRRNTQRRLVTESLMLEMDRVSKSHGARFAVVLLTASDQYLNFLQTNNISVINCAYSLTSDKKVPGEGHPNGILNTLWYECIANALTEQNLLNDNIMTQVSNEVN